MTDIYTIIPRRDDSEYPAALAKYKGEGLCRGDASGYKLEFIWVFGRYKYQVAIRLRCTAI